MNSDILIYQNQDGNIKIDVRLEEETVWLTQAHMGALFGKDKRTISEHLGNVFSERELEENSVVRNFRITTPHGTIAGKTQEVEVNDSNLLGLNAINPTRSSAIFPKTSKNTQYWVL
jgi:hypothetical protein